MKATFKGSMKTRARNALVKAVSDGRIQKPESCSHCDRSTPKGDLEGHHPDYSRPFDVEWLCRSCHRRKHREEAPPRMKRALILLTEAQYARLAELARRQGNSLAAVVRAIVEEYLERQAPPEKEEKS